MNAIKTLPSVSDISKERMMEILLSEEYGYLPSSAVSVTALSEAVDEDACSGKAYLEKIKLTCAMEKGSFSFPVYFARPKGAKGRVPCFIHIGFDRGFSSKYQPTDEIIDRGYAILSFCYRDVTSDDGDFTNGLAGVIYPDGKRGNNACGKIGIWAFATMRVMDLAQTLPSVDGERISVVGHSRLGKTALLAGALDERFFCAISNESGCSGASLARGSKGERIADITRAFPYWFCENYKKYVNREGDMPFDQHFLVSANYPHRVYVSSAEGDAWACPENEYLACVAASEYYERLGKRGIGRDGDSKPSVGTSVHKGHIGYHIREGAHCLSLTDWNEFMDYLDRAAEQKEK